MPRIPLCQSITYETGKECRLNAPVQDLVDKAIGGGRLSTRKRGFVCWSRPIWRRWAAAADAVARRLHPEPYRTYNIDRNINYTNICIGGCRFCAFSCRPGSPQGYVIQRESLYEKIEETIALGGDQILLQGGLHPELPLAWYEDLLRDIKRRFPQINVHGFSPAEIHHIAQVSGLPVRRRAGAARRRRPGKPARRRGGNSRRPGAPGRKSAARSPPPAGWRSAAPGTASADADRPR